MHRVRFPGSTLVRGLIPILLVALPVAPVLAPSAAHAQAEQTGPRRSYDIPAGTLEDALNRFARQAGITLSFDPAQVAGRTTPALQGEYSVREGLAALLASHTLQAVRAADGSYSLKSVAAPSAARNADTPAGKAAAVSEAQMPEVMVTSESEPRGQAVTEGTGSYTTPSMSTATGLALSIRETPQSVTVITRDRMDDQGLSKSRQIMENTPGITITASAPYREDYHSRGFGIDSYMFDGLPVSANDSRAGMFLNDLDMYDRVEVVRGATGLMTGTGTPSAAINFVRKRPTRDFQASVFGEIGSWSHLGAGADVSGSLNEAGTLRGRGVVSLRDADSFMDVVTEKRQLVYAIGELDITSSTVLTAGFSWQKNDNNTSYGGLPTAPDGSDLGLPRSTYLGNTWNFWNDTSTMIFASLEHRLENRWKLSAAVNYIDGDQEEMRSDVYWTGTQYDQTGGYAEIGSKRTSLDVHAEGPFQLLGREHGLIVGAAMRNSKEANDTAGYFSYTFASNIDIYNWNHDAPQPAAFPWDYHRHTKEEQYGVYAATRLNPVDPLKVILGLRADWYKYDYADEYLDLGVWNPYTESYKQPRHLTKYAGVIYDLGAFHSVYASYTDIFQPQGDVRDRSGALIDPILGKNYEVGIKGEYFGGRLNASAAVFRIDQENLAMLDGPCPFNPSIDCYRAAGMVRSEGFDLELQGALTPNWQIGAGFNYVSTEIREDADPALIGTKQNTDMPARQLKLTTTYRLPGGQWRIGGNVRWQDDVYHTDDWMGYRYHTEQEAYAVVDAMIGYRHDKHLDVQLNVFNLFDETYYRAINSQPVEWGGNTVYGEPRRVLLTARYAF